MNPDEPLDVDAEEERQETAAHDQLLEEGHDQVEAAEDGIVAADDVFGRGRDR